MISILKSRHTIALTSLLPLIKAQYPDTTDISIQSDNATSSASHDIIAYIHHLRRRRAIVKPSHFDLVMGTRAMLQRCRIQWTPHHVKGHQNHPNSSAGAMGQPQHLNDVATPPRLYKISGELWLSGLDPANFRRTLQDTIQDVIHGPHSLAHWTKRGKFGNESNIDHAMPLGLPTRF
jgi:hypothetical protein